MINCVVIQPSFLKNEPFKLIVTLLVPIIVDSVNDTSFVVDSVFDSVVADGGAIFTEIKLIYYLKGHSSISTTLP